jgi:hypothetical protein
MKQEHVVRKGDNESCGDNVHQERIFSNYMERLHS